MLDPEEAKKLERHYQLGIDEKAAISLRVPKSTKEQWIMRAEDNDQSLSRFILDTVNKRIDDEDAKGITEIINAFEKIAIEDHESNEKDNS